MVNAAVWVVVNLGLAVLTTHAGNQKVAAFNTFAAGFCFRCLVDKIREYKERKRAS